MFTFFSFGANRDVMSYIARYNGFTSSLITQLYSVKKMVLLTVLDTDDYNEFVNKNALVISYGIESTPFGKCLIGLARDKICHLSFINGSENIIIDEFKKQWPKASFSMDAALAKSTVEKIFNDDVEMEVIIRGTAFELNVWKALLDIKKGETRYYSDIAKAIGYPKAHRAVANAIGKNRVSYLVPCHRVISKHGDVYKYGGGPLTKKKLLEYEGVTL